MPELVFKGKEYVYNHHLTVPYRPLVPDKSKSIGPADLSGNLIIHGDNLHALKSLLPRYAGKVDLIFIDPPYNTGNENWAYNDNVNSPIMKEWLRSNPVNAEDMLRHDKWLCMMWPRLVLLRDLLSANGVLAVFIGNDEQHRLRAVLDEIFGAERFVTTLCWRSRAKPSNTGDAKRRPQQDAEYVHLYGASAASRFNLVVSGEVRRYPKELDGRRYRLATILKSNLGGNRRPDSMRGEVAGFTPPPEQRWQAHTDVVRKMYSDNKIEFIDGYPMQRIFEDEEPDETSPFYCFVDRIEAGTAEGGKSLLTDVMGAAHNFDTVKPLQIVEYLTKYLSQPASIVLDSFAGSGTTAHAVMIANAKDQGNRRFILVEGEDYADTLTAERVRRVIKGYSFVGSKREQLLRAKITWSKLKKVEAVLKEVDAIKAREGFVEGDLADQGTNNKKRFDKVSVKMDGGELLVEGEKKISERVEGLGGEFTFCTLGEPMEAEKILSGKTLPDYASLGAWLFHTATGGTLDTSRVDESLSYLGEAKDRHVWLIYKPELSFLKSTNAALTLSFAQSLREKKPGKPHLVFAAAKFMSNKQLLECGVEFASLPFGLYREA
ncbi:MAG: site-specific DNA-methyltransferase [Rhodocyclaceae bacterium]|nr:site-specific DNA-methyltransferase [Rhodocyclaceae bacterium]